MTEPVRVYVVWLHEGPVESAHTLPALSAVDAAEAYADKFDAVSEGFATQYGKCRLYTVVDAADTIFTVAVCDAMTEDEGVKIPVRTSLIVLPGEWESESLYPGKGG